MRCFCNGLSSRIWSPVSAMFPIAFLFSVYSLFTCACLLFWYFCTSTFGYWKKQKIKFKEPVPFFGNITRFALLLEPFHLTLHNLYKFFADDDFAGFYQMRDPILLVKNPDLVHSILVKDFKNFCDRGFDFVYPDKELNPLSLHLFVANGDRWRALRKKMSTIFTSGKLKYMHDDILNCVTKLNTLLEREMENNAGDLNLKNMYERLTIDVIGCCAFGIACNSLKDNDQFREMGQKVFQPTWINSARILVAVFSKKLLKKLRLPDVSKEVTSFFKGMVLDTILYRRQTGKKRNDLLELLMDLQNAYDEPKYANPQSKENVSGDERFDEIHICANSFLFFAAGFETTASTLSFCLYEMSINQDIQDRLRTEIEAAYKKHNQVLSYECLKDIPYLDAVISETLRKYPPLPWLIRETIEDYPIPHTDKVIEKGTRVVIPTWSIQHDWRYYPNPEQYDPERFYGDNANNMRAGTYMPFGDGPRYCIGSRFAKMELRTALADAMLRYKFEPCLKTEIPLKFTGGSLMMSVQEGIFVRVSKRK